MIEPTCPPVRGEIADETPRPRPFIVPWTEGEYRLVRYLAGCLRGKLADVGREALRRGLKEMARENLAERKRTGKYVPQRLALLAQGEIKRPDSSPPP